MIAKHIKFADKYFETDNALESAIYAGYSPKTAKEQGYKIKEREDVKQYLAEQREKYAKKAGIDKEWIIERFKNISDRCVQAEEVLDKNGNPTGEYRFDSAGANKATEMLGKIIGSFEKDNEQKKVDVNINLSKEKIKQISDTLENDL